MALKQVAHAHTFSVEKILYWQSEMIVQLCPMKGDKEMLYHSERFVCGLLF